MEITSFWKITQFATKQKKSFTVNNPLTVNIAVWDASLQLCHSHCGRESRSEYILYLIEVNKDNLPDWFAVCFGVLHLGTNRLMTSFVHANLAYKRGHTNTAHCAPLRLNPVNQTRCDRHSFLLRLRFSLNVYLCCFYISNNKKKRI